MVRGSREVRHEVTMWGNLQNVSMRWQVARNARSSGLVGNLVCGLRSFVLNGKKEAGMWSCRTQTALISLMMVNSLIHFALQRKSCAFKGVIGF